MDVFSKLSDRFVAAAGITTSAVYVALNNGTLSDPAAAGIVTVLSLASGLLAAHSFLPENMQPLDRLYSHATPIGAILGVSVPVIAAFLSSGGPA